MRIVAISDTHTKHNQIRIPDGDVFVFAGDMSYNGELHTFTNFNKWVKELPHTHKLVIAGNHDKHFYDKVGMNPDEYNFTYLEDEGLFIDDTYFYGTPWTPTFFDWYFMKDDNEDIANKYNHIKLYTDVLITHGPPYGILDVAENNNHVGSKVLREVVDAFQPKISIFGHIHDPGVYEWFNMKFYNVSVLDHKYNIVNGATVIDI